MKLKILITLLAIFSFTYVYSNSYSKSVLGYSVNNRKIELYKFGKGNQLIIIIAGIHGNEQNTTKTALQLIKHLNEKKIKIPVKKSIWIIPNLNPDGYDRDRRINENNVDLNRNFDTENWIPYYYYYNVLLSAGKHPFSEPETILMKHFFESIDKTSSPIVLSLHSKGNVIIPGNNSPGNIKLMYYLTDKSSFAPSEIGYKTTGDLTNWVSSKLGIASATIELKTKSKIEIDELTNILNSLTKIDFKEKFYKYEIKSRIQTKIDTTGLINMLNGLPPSIINNITKTEEAKKTFIKIYNGLDSDEELLLLVNKTHHLNSDYEPKDLEETVHLFPSNKKTLKLRKIILDDLEKLFISADQNGINLKLVSGYRSYQTQKQTFEYWKNKYGEKEAMRISALPGASQHQLGTTIDFNSLQQSFGESEEGIWLSENAFKFGFIMSYPEGQEELTGYSYEPWHYRYIGKNAAFLVYNYFDNLMEIFLQWYWEKKSYQ